MGPGRDQPLSAAGNESIDSPSFNILFCALSLSALDQECVRACLCACVCVCMCVYVCAHVQWLSNYHPAWLSKEGLSKREAEWKARNTEEADGLMQCCK